MWGVQSGWNGVPMQSPQQALPTSGNIWGQPQAQQSFGAFGNLTSANAASLGTQDIWSTPGGLANDPFGNSFTTTTAATQQKKDDAFSDIWGGFK